MPDADQCQTETGLKIEMRALDCITAGQGKGGCGGCGCGGCGGGRGGGNEAKSVAGKIRFLLHV